MKKSTVIAATVGTVVGVAGGVSLCATKFGQEKVLMPVMAGKEYLKNKFHSKEEETEEEIEEVAEEATSENEHVEKD